MGRLELVYRNILCFPPGERTFLFSEIIHPGGKPSAPGGSYLLFTTASGGNYPGGGRQKTPAAHTRPYARARDGQGLRTGVQREGGKKGTRNRQPHPRVVQEKHGNDSGSSFLCLGRVGQHPLVAVGTLIVVIFSIFKTESAFRMTFHDDAECDYQMHESFRDYRTMNSDMPFVCVVLGQIHKR